MSWWKNISHKVWCLGPQFNIGNTIVEIRWSLDHLIFLSYLMGFPYSGKMTSWYQIRAQVTSMWFMREQEFCDPCADRCSAVLGHLHMQASVINDIEYNWLIRWQMDNEITTKSNSPDSKVPGANMGPIWGRQDPGGPHVGLMNFAIWVTIWAAGCVLIFATFRVNQSLNILRLRDAYMHI